MHMRMGLCCTDKNATGGDVQECRDTCQSVMMEMVMHFKRPHAGG